MCKLGFETEIFGSRYVDLNDWWRLCFKVLIKIGKKTERIDYQVQKCVNLVQTEIFPIFVSYLGCFSFKVEIKIKKN